MILMYGNKLPGLNKSSYNKKLKCWLKYLVVLQITAVALKTFNLQIYHNLALEK